MAIDKEVHCMVKDGESQQVITTFSKQMIHCLTNQDFILFKRCNN